MIGISVLAVRYRAFVFAAPLYTYFVADNVRRNTREPFLLAQFPRRWRRQRNSCRRSEVGLVSQGKLEAA
jgi:hypothetical protein